LESAAAKGYFCRPANHLFMVIFINDRPLKLTQAQRADLRRPHQPYDAVLDTRLDAVRPEVLAGHVLVLNGTSAGLERLLEILHTMPLPGLQSIIYQVPDVKAAEADVKNFFTVVKAAGGVVFKGDKILLMYRLKRWDLPKGKLDPFEKSKQAAVREVEEECNIEVALDEKLCTTWHTYTQNGNRILKKTKWYRMTCLDDHEMAPQVEENIEKLVWMDRKQIQNALVDSYSSIRYVFEKLWNSVEAKVAK
jgi:8-oxo-dGTP pyrophosphatase MutT (NUDIX family)